MTNNDKNNLMFLLSLSQKDLNLWYANAGVEDQDYADWLLIEALNIVADAIEANNIEHALDNMPSYKDAMSVIDKVKA